MEVILLENIKKLGKELKTTTIDNIIQFNEFN